MALFVVILVFVVIGIGLTILLRFSFASAAAQARLSDDLAWQLNPLTGQPVEQASVKTKPATIRNPLRRRWWWAPYVLGAVCSLAMVFLTGIPQPIGWSSGLVVALLLAQVEVAFYQRRIAMIEQQLIDLLDMMIPMLRSGAGAMMALGAAAEQIKNPLREQIEWSVRRIQLGDRGTDTFQKLSARVPTGVIELFCTTMAVHWETGGALAPILASVGRVTRDRQEIARRIRSNIAQSQFSTVAVLCLIYFVAAILWFDRPEQVEAFVNSQLGSLAVATTIVLQAVGIVWMNAMSRPQT